jgi:hypothetical protein
MNENCWKLLSMKQDEKKTGSYENWLIYKKRQLYLLGLQMKIRMSQQSCWLKNDLFGQFSGNLLDKNRDGWLHISRQGPRWPKDLRGNAYSFHHQEKSSNIYKYRTSSGSPSIYRAGPAGCVFRLQYLKTTSAIDCRETLSP